MSLFADYPYLWGTLGAVAVLLVITALLSGHRRRALFSGLALAPTGLFAFSFGGYWTPARLGGWPVGIEDLLFSFGSGLAAWLIVTASPFTRQLGVRWNGRGIARRVAPVAVAIPVLYFALLALGANPMTGLIAGLLVAAAVSVVYRPGLWPLAVPGIVGYPILHLVALALAARVWPDLFSVWTLDHQWGVPVFLGIPAGEVVWAAVFGASWPLVVAYFLDARPKGSG